MLQPVRPRLSPTDIFGAAELAVAAARLWAQTVLALDRKYRLGMWPVAASLARGWRLFADG